MATIAARMQQRRRSETQWTSENPTLAAGELGVSVVGMKLGDGTTAFNNLSYIVPNDVERTTARQWAPTGTATESSISGWPSVLLANATTGGLTMERSFPSFWNTASLSWGYVPVTGGNNVRWTVNIFVVNALGFGTLVTDAAVTTASVTQAMGTTNQIEHVFNLPSTFPLHNVSAVLGDVVRLEITRIGGDAADTSTSDCHVTNISLVRLS